MKWVYAQAAGGDQPTLLLLESPNLSAKWALDLLGPWMMEWGGDVRAGATENACS